MQAGLEFSSGDGQIRITFSSISFISVREVCCICGPSKSQQHCPPWQKPIPPSSNSLTWFCTKFPGARAATMRDEGQEGRGLGWGGFCSPAYLGKAPPPRDTSASVGIRLEHKNTIITESISKAVEREENILVCWGFFLTWTALAPSSQKAASQLLQSDRLFTISLST